MAKKAKREHVYAAINSFIEELYANGAVGKWNVEKKLKQAKRVQRKAVMEISEHRVINECLEEIHKSKKTT